ncbi:probable ubiquitin-conjugating enzyme e2 25 [Phtheirospermum japonicum]|uniref:Probable ubiquitin-conjugating enzyme e2 25 n=1 Tax=Phtheirospermum japonicum TaxID=374723 RepID=A0A830C4Z0_9LAMI|nr:probable ubiquitin-conjugating enzyme e2 25 [Phtheirospermum japonicum]
MVMHFGGEFENTPTVRYNGGQKIKFDYENEAHMKIYNLYIWVKVHLKVEHKRMYMLCDGGFKIIAKDKDLMWLYKQSLRTKEMHIYIEAVQQNDEEEDEDEGDMDSEEIAISSGAGEKVGDNEERDISGRARDWGDHGQEGDRTIEFEESDLVDSDYDMVKNVDAPKEAEDGGLDADEDNVDSGEKDIVNYEGTLNCHRVSDDEDGEATYPDFNPGLLFDPVFELGILCLILGCHPSKTFVKQLTFDHIPIFYGGLLFTAVEITLFHGGYRRTAKKKEEATKKEEEKKSLPAHEHKIPNSKIPQKISLLLGLRRRHRKNESITTDGLNLLTLTDNFEKLTNDSAKRFTIPFWVKQAQRFCATLTILRIFDVIEDYSDHHYAKNGSFDKQLPKNWAKRIQEWKILEKDLPDEVFVRVYEVRMDLLRAVIIGAEGTPYHGGLFFFDVFFPSSYPNVPLHVHYHSRGLRINPNLYNCGKVCLSLLNTWGGSQKEKCIPLSLHLSNYVLFKINFLPTFVAAEGFYVLESIKPKNVPENQNQLDLTKIRLGPAKHNHRSMRCRHQSTGLFLCIGGQISKHCSDVGREKKLSKVIVPDKWKEGSHNTTEGGGRKINENKLLSKKNRSMCNVREASARHQALQAKQCITYLMLLPIL